MKYAMLATILFTAWTVSFKDSTVVQSGVQMLWQPNYTVKPTDTCVEADGTVHSFRELRRSVAGWEAKGRPCLMFRS